jgi:hypothetical protein
MSVHGESEDDKELKEQLHADRGGAVSGRKTALLISKIVLSAFCGLLIAAFLVIYPGVFFLPPKSDLHSQLGPKLTSDLRNVHWSGESHGLTYSNTHELRGQMLWLSFAQQEIEYLPILLGCSCIGPAILILCHRKPKQISNNTKRNPFGWAMLVVVLLFYVLSFLLFVCANLGESM